MLIQFIFQGEGPLEYVIEVPDANELREWLQAIQECIRPAGVSAANEGAATM